jgi:hypothetical protein
MRPTIVVRPLRRARSRAATFLLAAVAGAAVLAAPAPAQASPTPPDPGSCHLVDFTTASVETLVSPDPSGVDHRLTVTGPLRELAQVSLVELTYIRQPEFWGVEVTACPIRRRPFPVTLPAARFRAVLDFRGSLGTCGIEIIGLTVRQTINLAGPPACRVAIDPPPPTV